MSTQSLHQFLDKAKKDSSLKQRLADASNPKEVITLGKQWGYNFSEQDMQQATKERMKSGEVSQDDLENVSGGTILTPVTIVYFTVTVCGRAA